MPPDRLDRVAILEALLRETLKTIVLVSYLGFAIWLLLSTGEPYGFVPLLPWALWSRNELRGFVGRTAEARKFQERPTACRCSVP